MPKTENNVFLDSCDHTTGFFFQVEKSEDQGK